MAEYANIPGIGKVSIDYLGRDRLPNNLAESCDEESGTLQAGHVLENLDDIFKSIGSRPLTLAEYNTVREYAVENQNSPEYKTLLETLDDPFFLEIVKGPDNEWYLPCTNEKAPAFDPKGMTSFYVIREVLSS